MLLVFTMRFRAFLLVPYLKSVALHVPELIGGSQKFGMVPGYIEGICPQFVSPSKNFYMPILYILFIYMHSVQFSSVTIFMSRASLIIQDYDGCAHA